MQRITAGRRCRPVLIRPVPGCRSIQNAGQRSGHKEYEIKSVGHDHRADALPTERGTENPYAGREKGDQKGYRKEPEKIAPGHSSDDKAQRHDRHAGDHIEHALHRRCHDLTDNDGERTHAGGHHDIKGLALLLPRYGGGRPHRRHDAEDDKLSDRQDRIKPYHGAVNIVCGIHIPVPDNQHGEKKHKG